MGQGACLQPVHALAIDYFQESFHRWLMTAHSIMGDRTLAIAHYEELCNTLMRELDAEPDPATTALVNRIKSQPEMAPPIRRPDPEPTALPAAVSFRLATSSMPLVGRASLLNEVLGSLAPQEIGEGAFVLLHGEAGIGKTRLVEEALRAILQPEGSRRLAKPFGAVLVGHCAPYGEDLSYAPIVECIHANCTLGKWIRQVLTSRTSGGDNSPVWRPTSLSIRRLQHPRPCRSHKARRRIV